MSISRSILCLSNIFQHCARAVPGSALVFVLTIAALVSGCGPAKSDPSSTSVPAKGPDSTNRPVLTREESMMMQPFVSGGTSEADKAWEQVGRSLEQLMNALQPTPAPSDQDDLGPDSASPLKPDPRAASLAMAAAEKAKDFYTRFGDNEHAEEAREQEYRLLTVAAQMGNTNAVQGLGKIEEARLANPNTTEDERLELRMGQLQRSIVQRREEGMTNTLNALEQAARAMQKEFPQRIEVLGLLLSAAEGRLENGQIDKSRALANELAAMEAQPELQKQAQQLLTKLDRIGRPLALQFKSLDGKMQDLQQLKGKVVLIDFWATWCRPCIVELPKVKEAYAKWHDKGFEILGISLDEDKADLERLVAEQKISWPQCFDREQSQFATQFGVASIPTMWLVDKKGLLREVNARDNLDQKLARLMSEN